MRFWDEAIREHDITLRPGGNFICGQGAEITEKQIQLKFGGF